MSRTKIVRGSLFSKIIFLVSIIVLLCLTIGSILFAIMVQEIIDEKLGNKALIVAKIAAQDKRIIAAFESTNPSILIQPIAEELRLLSGAGYVVIGNLANIRYSHHLEEEIGREMGTSNDVVFNEHRSIIYKGTGVSGDALKAKAPIFNEQGDLIGVASVGFLTEQIIEEWIEYLYKVSQLFIIPLLLGIIGAYIVAKSVKKMIFGLEPEEISYLFTEKEAVLESIHDAIIAVDIHGKVVSINKSARQHLALPTTINSIQDLNFQNLYAIYLETIQTGIDQQNRKVLLHNKIFILDTSLVYDQEKLKGMVFTFRPIHEVEQMTEEILKIKEFAEHMRAHNHEFLNKLNIIYGLLKLNETDKAIDLIAHEVKDRQDLIAFLIDSVNEPLIAACLLGKTNRARELKVGFFIEPESELLALPASFDSHSFVSILSNIIENAFEAAHEKNGPEAYVKIAFTDIGQDIVFDIEDNGRGISIEEERVIFEEGYSTKKCAQNHGLGLTIVQNNIKLLNGELQLGQSDLGGARFTIIIPKAS